MKMKSTDHYKAAAQRLKELGVTPIGHWAPYADGYHVGGPVQFFIDEENKIHRFVFNSKTNEIIHYECHHSSPPG